MTKTSDKKKMKKISVKRTKGEKAHARKEIRIVDPSDKVFEVVIGLAEKEKRSIGKQAEYMLERFIENESKK